VSGEGKKRAKKSAEAKAKKLEYERIFNEIFGVSIKWSKLSLEELSQLAAVLANPEPLIRRLGGVPETEVTETALVKMVRKILEYEGPLIRFLKKYLKPREKRGEEGTSPAQA
jgi:hypothetical protein